MTVKLGKIHPWHGKRRRVLFPATGRRTVRSVVESTSCVCGAPKLPPEACRSRDVNAKLLANSSCLISKFPWSCSLCLCPKASLQHDLCAAPVSHLHPRSCARLPDPSTSINMPVASVVCGHEQGATGNVWRTATHLLLVKAPTYLHSPCTDHITELCFQDKFPRHLHHS